MPRLVQKYGGASLSDRAKLKAIADRISNQRKSGDDIIVVVSAMGRTTDSLLAQAKELACCPEPRELNALISTGETVTAAMI